MKAGNDEITSELMQLGAKKLASHNKGSGFGVPEGYFDGFSEAVQNKIIAQQHTPNTSKTIYLNLRTSVRIAASVLLVAGLAIALMLLQNNRLEVVALEYDDRLYEEFFADAALNDRNMLYDLLFEQASGSFEVNNSGDADFDYLFDYLLDASQYLGIEPKELVALTETENQN